MPRIYTDTIMEALYTFRGATRSEALAALECPTTAAAEDYLVACCVLSVTEHQTKITTDAAEIDWPNVIAGIATQLADRIRNVSGLSPGSQNVLRSEAHNWLNSPVGHAEMLMMGILGRSLSEIHALDPPDWFKEAAAAQTLYDIQNQGGGDPPPQGPSKGPPQWQNHKSENMPEQAFSFHV